MANKGCNLMQLERALKDLDMYVKHEKPPVLKEKILDSNIEYLIIFRV